jgi:hypothetical protein
MHGESVARMTAATCAFISLPIREERTAAGRYRGRSISHRAIATASLVESEETAAMTGARS